MDSVTKSRFFVKIIGFESYCLRNDSFLNIIKEKRKESISVKTISIRLEDTLYDELSEMLNAMGQTKQTFYESFTRMALRERRIPFIISAPIQTKPQNVQDKLEAFARLEASRKLFSESIEYDVEREEAMNAKYGSID